MTVKNTLLLLALCSLVSASSITDTMLYAIWEFSLSKLRATMDDLGNDTSQFPRRAPQTEGKWQTVPASDWTSGFYPGCLWFAYEESEDEAFRDAARQWTAALDGQKNNTGTHDVGFMIFCSYGNGYFLLDTDSYLPVMKTAAQSLSTRYKPLAGIIDSWNVSPYDSGWEEIIDNMMNLELLFWVAANGGSSEYHDMAVSHAEHAMANHFRDDGSTYHVVRYSRTTGEMTGQETRQGYTDESCWARGQAWAVYGFTMAYRFTEDERFLATARKAADYYLEHLPDDRVPFWDFDAPGIPADTVPRDASSSAIVASALLELAAYTGAPDSARYFDAAVSLIQGLWTEKYRGRATQASILNHSTGSRKENHDVDMGIIYADYYFLEALLRYEKLIRTATTYRHHVKPLSLGDNVSSSRISARYNLLGRSIGPWEDLRSPGLLIRLFPGMAAKPEMELHN